MTVHPDLIAAQDQFLMSEPGELIGIVLRARARAEAGVYCGCTEPALVGFDLLCQQCLLNNQHQERRAVVRMVRAHDFVPSKSGLICDVCTAFREHRRHAGVDGAGWCSWGEELAPPYPEELL